MNSRRTSRRITLLALSGLLALGVASCSSSGSTSSDKVGGKVDVNSSDGEVNVKTKDGQVNVTRSKDLPSGWPTEILPVPKGFTITGSTSAKTPQGNSQVVNAEGSGDMKDILSSFEKSMEDAGVKVGLSASTGEGGTVNGSKGKEHYTVLARTEGSKTTVVMTVLQSTS